MTREDFLAELEQALASLPYAERRDALNYYEEYFDSAGSENEAKTIADLGSPQDVARSILEEQTPGTTSTPSSPKKPHSLRMWLGGGIAVLVLGCFFFQQAKATPEKVELPAASVTSSAVQSQTAVSSHEPASITTEISSAATSNEPADLTSTPPVSDSQAELPASTVSQPQTAVTTQDPASTTTETSSVAPSNEPADLTITLPVSDLQDLLDLELAYGSVQFKTAPADTENATFEFQDFLLDYLHQNSPAEHQTCFTYKLPEDFSVSHLPKPALTITLPENALKKLKGKLALGDLSLGEMALTDLNVTLAMGDLNALSLTASSARVNLAMGDLEINALDCKESRINLAMGNAEIGLLIHSEELTLENAMGDVKLTIAGAPSDYDLTVHSVGTLRVDGNSYKLRYNSGSDSDRHARITSAMGSVTVSFQS